MTTYSHAEQTDVACPKCGKVFSADVWFMIDPLAFPDMLERASTGHFYRITCPNGHTFELDRPLLIYLSEQSRLLLCYPTHDIGAAEQHLEQATNLVGTLCERMGPAWNDAWISRGLPAVPFDLLRLVLTDGIEAALEALADKVTNPYEALPIPTEFLLLPRQAEISEDRYRTSGDPSVLEQAVCAWEGVLSCPRFVTAPQHFRLDVLNRSGITLLSRYWLRGELSDLDRALHYWEEAVGIDPNGASLPK